MVRILKVGKVAWRVANEGDRLVEGRPRLRRETPGPIDGVVQALAALPGARDGAASLSSE